MRMTPDIEESISCTVPGCSCVCFKPGGVQLRSCDRCGHGWVVHALEKLHAQPPSSCGPVEVALPGLVFDLSSLVLYGAQAIPVRLKILLDRLYSILTPQQVGHIVHTLGWTLGDYVRGYMLQYPSGKVLDCWLMVTPEEELLVLKQFLRFGETRPIVELMTLQCLEADLVPPTKLTLGLQKPSANKLTEGHMQEGGRREEEDDLNLQRSRGKAALKIKVDPDKPNPPWSLWHQTPPFNNDHELDLHRGTSKQEATSFISSSSSSLPKISQKVQASPSSSLHPLSSFSSSFLCPLPNSSFSSSLHHLPSSSSTLHPLPSSLCSLPSPCPAGSRKGRVCCGVCGKSFYDKGTLKIHYNAVHLKIKHRCTVAGCTMVFSSLRSRNRHSANPNPRLHTGTSRDAPSHRNTQCDHTSRCAEAKQARKNIHDTRMCRKKESSNTFRQQGNDAHTREHVQSMRNGVNGCTHPQPGCQHNKPPRADSPHSVHPALSHDTNQALPPPLLPAHHASSQGFCPFLVPLIVPAPETPKRHQDLLTNPTSPVTTASCDSRSVSHDWGEGEACTSSLTIQQWLWESADPTPKKKPRKSSMPVKIERETAESRRNEDDEE